MCSGCLSSTQHWRVGVAFDFSRSSCLYASRVLTLAFKKSVSKGITSWTLFLIDFLWAAVQKGRQTVLAQRSLVDVETIVTHGFCLLVLALLLFTIIAWMAKYGMRLHCLAEAFLTNSMGSACQL